MPDRAAPFAATHDSERFDAARAARGDVEAFERLYRRHLPSIHRLAGWLLATRETDDVIQEVFVRAWTKMELFQGRSTFGTWLRRLAVNVIRRHRRRLNRPGHDPEGSGGIETRNSAPLPEGLRIDLENAVATLPDGAREVFVLHDVEGLKHREIASALGIAASTSRVQLHRARMLLRRFLD